jgi:hypothetical protein
MGCCGDREKGRTVTEEQKWDFIVSTWENVNEAHMLITLEPIRLQVYVVSRALLLRLAVDSRRHLLRRLRCRCLHRRQSSRLRQVDESS